MALRLTRKRFKKNLMARIWTRTKISQLIGKIIVIIIAVVNGVIVIGTRLVIVVGINPPLFTYPVGDNR